MAYTPRIIDAELDELMAQLPAICLEGAKGVGKTATATRRADSIHRLDELAVREIVEAHPARLDEGEATTLLDEWQRAPWVWDHVRRRVDDGAKAGSYLLTGSAVPVGASVHSGAGRIANLRMRPLALSERGLDRPTVSLSALLKGDHPSIEGSASATLEHYVEEIVRSGFPGLRALSGRAHATQIDAYLDRVVEREFPEQGLRIRRPQTLRDWLAAYAAATSATASYNAILAAATPGEAAKPSKVTTIAYRDVLLQLWLLDPVPGWSPGHGHIRRLAQAPKHHLADPALAAALLGASVDALLDPTPGERSPVRDGTLLGALFESLVTLSVRTYAGAAQATTHHLRTLGGDHEVDLIVQRRDRRVVAVEVKLSATVDDRSVRNLLWLRERLGAELLDAAVITTGRWAYRRSDGIAVIPASLLGP